MMRPHLASGILTLLCISHSIWQNVIFHVREGFGELSGIYLVSGTKIDDMPIKRGVARQEIISVQIGE